MTDEERGHLRALVASTSPWTADDLCIVSDCLGELLDAYQERDELHEEKRTDAWHAGWQVAVRERDDARRECNTLRTLVAQQREALLASLEWLTCDCPDEPVSGVTRHYGDECPIEKARAVLAQEVPRE